MIKMENYYEGIGMKVDIQVIYYVKQDEFHENPETGIAYFGQKLTRKDVVEAFFKHLKEFYPQYNIKNLNINDDGSIETYYKDDKYYLYMKFCTLHLENYESE